MAHPPEEAPGRIFISYRREDTAYPAGWLFDRLVDKYGDEVFKDVDSIELGDDFVEVINKAVGSCDVLLALIGEEWVTITDDRGRRRLDDPDDYVRLEIEAALERNVRVIPILVDGAKMPEAEQLPASLGLLTRRQALELSPSQFDFDTSRLIKVLDKTLVQIRTEQHQIPVNGGSQAPEVTPPPPPDPEPEPPGPGGPRWGLIAAAVAGLAVLVVAVVVGAGALGGDDSGGSDGSSDTSVDVPVKGTLQDIDARRGIVAATFRRPSEEWALGRSDLRSGELDLVDANTGPGARVDVGTDDQDRTILLYSRCERSGECELFQRPPAPGSQAENLRLATETCNVGVFSIVAGGILFVRRGEGCEGSGLYIQRSRGEPPERIGGVVRGADFDGRRRATLSGKVLAITTGTQPGGERTEFRISADDPFRPPLVLDGAYLYFQHRVAGDSSPSPGCRAKASRCSSITCLTTTPTRWASSSSSACPAACSTTRGGIECRTRT